MNSFPLSLPDYARKLNLQDYQSLDEIELNTALEQSGDIRCIKPAQLSESQLSLSTLGRMIGRTGGVIGDPTEFYWADGHTFVTSPGHEPQEVMYLHFIGLKRSYHWAKYDPGRDYREFGFSAAGFEPWRKPPTATAALGSKAMGFTLRSLSWGRAQLAAQFSTSQRHRLKSLLRRA